MTRHLTKDTQQQIQLMSQLTRTQTLSIFKRYLTLYKQRN